MTNNEVKRCVAYVRRSTDKQSLSPGAQRAAIEQACSGRSWELVATLEETQSGSAQKRHKRPALDAAIALCDAGGADALVVAKLDRLARSALDFLQIVKQARDGGWALVVLSPEIDMSTPGGALCAGILANVAEFERELNSQRTREGLAVKRARGERIGGRPSALPEPVVARIRRQAAEGTALNAIATGLNRDAIPTGQGGKRWYASSVRSVLRRVGDR